MNIHRMVHLNRNNALLRMLAALTFCLALLTVNGQAITVVDTEGQPISFVSVTNDNGALVGTTDLDGRLADTKGNTRLHFSHVAFEPIVVNCDTLSQKRVVMTEINYALGDIEVKPKELAYVQTYYRLIYFDEDGPIYYRAGVIDNTYDFATHKVSSKTRSLAKGSSGFLRFIISTLVGRYIDRWGQLHETSTYRRLLKSSKRGDIFITGDSLGHQTLSDTISVLGYVDTDTAARRRTTSFDFWTLSKHQEATKAAKKAAEDAAKGKTSKKKDKKDKNENEDDEGDNHSYYEVYAIDGEGRSRIDDFVMGQFMVNGHHRSSEDSYTILLQSYATDRNYIDKKEYKQLRKDNKVDMNIFEIKQFEQSHKIPPMEAEIQAQIDKLFEKELGKKK